MAFTTSDAGLKHGDEARRAAKAQMGQLGLGAGGDNVHSEQDPAAKDRCHQRASAAGVKLASSEPLRRTSLYVAVGYPVGKVTVYDAFKKACSAAKIDDFRFHDLRHTFASHLVMAGVDLVTVKELLGHKTINMTNRYTHLAQEHKAQAVAKLEDRYKAGDNATQSQSATVHRN